MVSKPEPVRYMTMDEVIQLTGWAKQTVKNRAVKDSWGRLPTRPPRYRMDDVLRSSTSTPDTRVRDHLLARHA